MALFRNFRDVPPTGFRYMERATGHSFEGSSWPELAQKVRSHREYKGLPVETVEKDIQNQLCLFLDERWCCPEPGETYEPVTDRTQSLTTDMAVGANKALLAFAKGGFRSCAEAEAARRAAICATCPLNKPSGSCSCHAVYRVVEAMVPAHRKQKGVSVCMACGCSLQAKVNMPDEVVRASITPGTVFPEWCWQRPLAT